MAQATARHILVDTEEKCTSLKEEIANGSAHGNSKRATSSSPFQM